MIHSRTLGWHPLSGKKGSRTFNVEFVLDYAFNLSSTSFPLSNLLLVNFKSADTTIQFVSTDMSLLVTIFYATTEKVINIYIYIYIYINIIYIHTHKRNTFIVNAIA